MNGKIQKIVNAFKDAILIDIPVSRTHKNLDLKTAYELRGLYESARKEAIERVGLDNLPYGLQDQVQYMQLAYAAALLESNIQNLKNKSPLEKEDIKEILENKKVLNEIYSKLTGYIPTDQFA